MNSVNLFYINDYNNFIHIIKNENNKIKNIQEIRYFINVTHAIIFGDDEVFISEKKYLFKKKIPLRFMPIAITRVINLKTNPEYTINTTKYEYIGRGSYWGNPYSLYDNAGDREDVINNYAYDFQFEYFPNKKKSEVFKLKGKRLGCFCKPKACHGDVLADFLNSFDDGK